MWKDSGIERRVLASSRNYACTITCGYLRLIFLRKRVSISLANTLLILKHASSALLLFKDLIMSLINETLSFGGILLLLSNNCVI